MKNRYAWWLLVVGILSPLSYAGGFMAISLGETDVDTAGFSSDSSYSLAAGMGITDYLLAEVAYIDLIDTNDNSSPARNLSVDGIDLSVILKADIAYGFGVFGKAGLFIWDAKLDDPDTDSHMKNDGTDLSIGFGVDYRITDKIEINLALQKFKMDDSDADNMSFGIVFNI